MKAARSVLGHLAATVAGTLATALLSIGYISLGARWLGPAEYGSVGAAVAAANMFFMTLNPLEASLTLEVARRAGRADLAGLAALARSMVRGMSLLALAALAAWCALAPWTASVSSIGSTGTLMGLGLFCCAAYVACGPRAVLRGRELFGVLARNLIFEGALRLLIGALLLWTVAGAKAMMFGYGAAASLAILHSARAMKQNLPASVAPHGSLREDVLAPFRTLSVPMLGLNAYGTIATNLDVLAATRFLEAREAGLYAGAASLSRMVPMAASPLLLVLFSRLAAQSAAGESTRQTSRWGALAVVGGLALSLLVPALFAQPILRTFLGPEYVGASALVLTQWATACVVTAQIFFGEALLASANVRLGWLFALPGVALVVALALFHETPLQIAQTSLLVCLSFGTAAQLLLRWRRR